MKVNGIRFVSFCRLSQRWNLILAPTRLLFQEQLYSQMQSNTQVTVTLSLLRPERRDPMWSGAASCSSRKDWGRWCVCSKFHRSIPRDLNLSFAQLSTRANSKILVQWEVRNVLLQVCPYQDNVQGMFSTCHGRYGRYGRVGMVGWVGICTFTWIESAHRNPKHMCTEHQRHCSALSYATKGFFWQNFSHKNRFQIFEFLLHIPSWRYI